MPIPDRITPSPAPPTPPGFGPWPAVPDEPGFLRSDEEGNLTWVAMAGGGLQILGAVDPADPPPDMEYAAGDLYFVSTESYSHADWTGIAENTPLEVGDSLLFDGTNWNVLQANVDPSAFLALSGGTMTQAAAIAFALPGGGPPSSPATRLNGNDPAYSAIDGFTIDCGTF